MFPFDLKADSVVQAEWMFGYLRISIIFCTVSEMLLALFIVTLPTAAGLHDWGKCREKKRSAEYCKPVVL